MGKIKNEVCGAVTISCSPPVDFETLPGQPSRSSGREEKESCPRVANVNAVTFNHVTAASALGLNNPLSARTVNNQLHSWFYDLDETLVVVNHLQQLFPANVELP